MLADPFNSHRVLQSSPIPSTFAAVDPVNGFLAGIATGIFISLLPGMLNMQVVSTSLRLGRNGGYVFALGMVLIIAVQATLAVLFADFLTGDLHIVTTIREYAMHILLVLALGFGIKGYFARNARKRKEDKKYTGGPFWRGVMMSAMNLLNIPFIFAIAGFLLAHETLPNSVSGRVAYIPGTALGSFAVLCGYSRSADWISRHAAFFTRNLYFFLSGMLALLAVVQLFQQV
ncbi:LysE family translocator [Lewinella sp. 4G2]|uniref:LysE family translocator n=1 Tax=Lewinella sp. 4G2 TaxID=1803372 RepID=UPI0007B49B30|nr:LysE family transporter [Lewinella sp. 4G2]OAV44625.1 hypothetical protein A3850_009030 [Lewinella sp. 4G2]